jgi:signal transduction histidine kinase
MSNPAPLPALQRIRACLLDLAQHGLIVAAFCLAIALGLWGLRSGAQLDVQLVYSFASGLVSWLFIDLGRFFVDRDSPYQFPRGWRAVALILAGCILGFVLGRLVGDAYSGHSTWEGFQDKTNMSLNFFVLSIVAGGAISYFFYATGKSHYLRSELEASQRQATEAQLQLLQSQLDPHMLFNTLANLRALIATDPPRATHMLDRLNDYLRSTLKASRTTEHSLNVEFDRLRDYLELMQIRMGERLRYTLDLPAELAQHKVPPLVLQSLVENAIVHGLEPKVGGGEIHISAQSQAGQLVLQVRDTGVGFDSANTPEGFGISQVRERLLTRYGQQATIHLVASPAIIQGATGLNSTQNGGSEGCTVLLRIPMLDTAKVLP